ncbi:hypothetical protein CEXT_382011 [Caerostris extrusa]|uniref:Uncharacterized protein n=1 Tax=Caerostris extrusa TaxID=172846 RepID=A0AAV4TFG6_CAEEX|nr:hypothetical protein CEXT_382011 [Caerostris extrusa]
MQLHFNFKLSHKKCERPSEGRSHTLWKSREIWAVEQFARCSTKSGKGASEEIFPPFTGMKHVIELPKQIEMAENRGALTRYVWVHNFHKN